MPSSQSKKARKVDLVGDLTQLLQMKQQHQAKLKQSKEQQLLKQMKQQQLHKQKPVRHQQQQLNQQKLQQLHKQQPKKEQQQTQQHQQPPVACVDVVVHWTRSERDKYSSIKLLAPW